MTALLLAQSFSFCTDDTTVRSVSNGTSKQLLSKMIINVDYFVSNFQTLVALTMRTQTSVMGLLCDIS